MEDVEVALVVTVANVTAMMEMGRKDVCIFVDRAVLNGGLLVSPDFVHLPEAAVQEIDLQVKRPSRHILVKVAQVGIVIH